MNSRQFVAFASVALVSVLLCLPRMSRAQDLQDLLRFSETNPAGTARSLAMGGAMTAVGADFSAATLNPAGLGLYRRGEITFTPSLRIANTTTGFLGTSADDSRANFGFAQLGLVFRGPIYRARDIGVQNTRGLSSYTIALGFNQQNNLWRRQSGRAVNPYNTFGDALAAQANGSDSDGLVGYQYAAFRSYYIDYAFNANNVGVPGTLEQSLTNYLPIADRAGLEQDFTIIERGRVNHWTVAGALNFSEEFFVGLGIGIMDYSYRSEFSLFETDVNGVYAGQLTPQGNAHISRMEFTDVSVLSGVGANARLGLLWQPLDFFRIGASIQSPTYAGMTLTYGPELYMVDNQDVREPSDGNLQAGTSDYTVYTPWRTNGGVAFLFGKKGMISADVEYVDYSSGEFRGSSGTSEEYFRALNSDVGTFMRSAVNYRVGAEFRPTSKLFVRAGYAVNQTPLTARGAEWGDLSTYNAARGTFNVQTTDRSRTTFSGGIGYRTRDWFVDFTVSYSTQKDVSLMHPVYNTPSGFQLIPDGANATEFVPYTVGNDRDGDGVLFESGDGLGRGLAPILNNKTIFVNAFLTIGFSINK